MMYADEPMTLASPRPAPISSDNDLLIPAFSGFVACVLSIIWARAFAPSAHDEATSAMALAQGRIVHLRSGKLHCVATPGNGKGLKILLR
jgi:hypothetical protein